MAVKTNFYLFILCIIIIFLSGGSIIYCDNFEEENYGVRYADECEVCKYMVEELEGMFTETGKVTEFIETGYHLDKRAGNKEKKEYKTSQLRLIESMESACDKILEYNIHKERKDSTRFARGQSQTFSTLHGLVDKGVKVDLGIPYELWDKPSAEISHLKTKCDDLMEKYESKIEDWYLNHQNKMSLKDFLCKNIVLRKKDSSCLYQVPSPSKDEKTEL